MVFVLSCSPSKQDTSPPGFDVKVMFLDGSGEAQQFPRDITKLAIKVTPYLPAVEGGDCDCSGTRCLKIYEADPVLGMVRLDDFNGDGSYEEAFMENLPYECPFYLEIFAYASDSLRVTYYSRVDGVKLTRGKRLFLKIALYLKNNQPVTLTQGDYPVAVFGHTATRLDRGTVPDYRVLIAGGFNHIEKIGCGPHAPVDPEHCPAPNTEEDCFQCYEAIATSDLFVFEQGSGKILKPILIGVGPVTLAAPRAFHTARQLADGRVLLAGGVDRAVIVFYNNDIMDGNETWHSGWEIHDIKPFPGTGYQGALKSFELFNPALNSDLEDLDRDGDFERGGMQGVEGAVPMTTARFLQADVYAPWQYPEDPVRENVLLLFGGVNADPIDTSIAPKTAEVFEVVAGNAQFSTVVTPILSALRAYPAAAIGGRPSSTDKILWIFGGVPYPGEGTTPNSAVVEKWVRNSSTGTYDPEVVTLPEPKPAFVRLFADAIPVPNPDTQEDDGKLIMVAGWYGARCQNLTGTDEVPTYDYIAAPTHICSPDAVANNFLVKTTENPPTFSAGPLPDTTTKYALGSTILLSCSERSRAGWILQSGGILDTDFRLSTVAGKGAISLYRPTGIATDPYEEITAASPPRIAPRMWHRAVELKGGSVLFVGGVKFNIFDDNPTAVIVDAVEILPFEGQCGDCNFESEPDSLGFETLTCCPQDCYLPPVP